LTGSYLRDTELQSRLSRFLENALGMHLKKYINKATGICGPTRDSF